MIINHIQTINKHKQTMLSKTIISSLIYGLYFQYFFFNICFCNHVRREAQTTETVILNTKTKLVVSAGNSTTIQLPRDQVVLSAFVFPESSNYKYQWELISPLNGQDFGNMEGINENQVKLTHLKAGNYAFKVTVNGDNVNPGSAIVNVTVLPMETKNKPPIVIVEPKNSTVQLPLAETILDGSTSIDDDKIIKYSWQALEVPIGYKILDSNSPILKLRDLIAGKYVFNLTVTDSRNATNSTLAQINVLKEIDYPPNAIVDPVISVNLPQDKVIIIGNKSTDDKGIVSWHWTRGDNGPMAIDMDGTSTPNLHLSRLEVGSYMFSLQVTDASGQTSKAETHLIVKQENNEAPNSNAGDNIEVTLPITEPIQLDGSKSSDDIGIKVWNWTQISGPKILPIRNANTSIALIDSAFPGVYNFSLKVVDVKNLSSISYKKLTIIQDQNIPPKAEAGGDKTVTLPITEVFLNGSRSFDDVEIIKFKWERMPLSSAFGNIIGNSDKTPILRLTNLIPGRYMFKLTVTDSRGASTSDVASLIVKPANDINEQIMVILNVNSESFTYEQEENFYKKLEALLSEIEQIKIRPISVSRNHEERTILIFAIQESKHKPDQVVLKIRSHLRLDSNYFTFQILSIHTVICQNKCSNHGTCDQFTKRCMCEAFWMENFFRFYYGDNVSNCEWSILYVIIICFIFLVMAISLIWLLVYLISQHHLKNYKKFSKNERNLRRSNRSRYMLINETENNELKSLKSNKNIYETTSTEDNSDIIVNYQKKPKRRHKISIG